MFFKAHKEIQYYIDGDYHTMTNLTKSSLIINKERTVLKSIAVNARTPEQVAFDEYEDARLFWTILYVNNIIDPFTEWYMPPDQLYEYSINKYGSEEELYKVRYFINRNEKSIIVGVEAERFFEMISNGERLPEFIDPIDNLGHERNLNENRNVIKIIPKENITRFVEHFKKTLK